MSKIIKTEAVVLSKMNYGDTSSIVSLFTKENGKISAIVKGARSPKSKYGRIIDPLNYLQIVFYKKESRDLQMISSAEIVDHFPHVKSELDKLKYAYAIIELVKVLMAEHEASNRVFNGLVRILSRLNSSDQKPEVVFGRFFIFMLKEIGYEIQIEKCAVCSREIKEGESLLFNFEKGVICGKCKEQAVEFYKINSELLRYLKCLKYNISTNNFNNSEPKRALDLMEKYLKFHVGNFDGIQSIKSFS